MPDGQQRWIAWSNQVQVGPRGERLLRSVGRDVTERKMLEQKLAANERFIREITDELPIRIAYVDKDGRYQFVNRAHCLRFGRSREDIIGRTRSELTGRVDAKVAARMQRALAGEPQCYEFEDLVNGQRRPHREPS
jgi:PAS domain S-box-containing protein